MIYFDNAASTYPKPTSVPREMSKWIKRNGANPGRSSHVPAMQAAELIFETRTRIADMFGVLNVENIAFVPNATYGLNIIIQGILRSGDHVITTDLEHNSVLRPILLAQKKGVSFDIAEVDLYDDDITVNNILSKIKKNTKAVVCTQCSNVCGKVLPIKKISNALPENVKIIVDGSQGAGSIPINIDQMGIDYYCAPSHKGLLGPQGSGFVAVSSDLPEPIIVGGTGSESFNLYQPQYMPDLIESGTLSTPAICGFNEGLKFIQSIGITKINLHKKRLTKYIWEKFKDIDGLDLYTDVSKSDFVGVFPFNVKNISSESFAGYLSKNNICVRSGIHCSPLFHRKMGTEDRGIVRVSFSYFNSFYEIDNLIKIVNKYLKK